MLKNALILTVLAFLITCTLLADSDSRPASAVEKTFFTSIAAACEAAIAGVKTGWEQTDKSGGEEEEFDLVGVGSENAPLIHHFYAEWTDQARIEKANTEISEALAAKMPEVQENSETPEMKKLEELADQIAAAASAGNLSEVDRLNREAEEIAARQEATFAATDKGIRDIIESMAPRDVKVIVRIAINQFYQGFDGEPTAGTLADGTGFYRVENGRMFNESWVEGTTYIFLGKGWEIKKEEAAVAMEKAEEKNSPHTRVQSIIIAVEAEQKKAADVLAGMNLKALQDLIK